MVTMWKKTLLHPQKTELSLNAYVYAKFFTIDFSQKTLYAETPNSLKQTLHTTHLFIEVDKPVHSLQHENTTLGLMKQI